MAYRPAAEVLVGCVRMPRFAVQVERWRFPELLGAAVQQAPLLRHGLRQRPAWLQMMMAPRTIGVGAQPAPIFFGAR